MKYVDAILLLALVTYGAWWLSAYDAKLSGDDTPADRRRRLVRTVLTLLLSLSILLLPLARGSLVVVYAISIVLAALWIGPGTEFGAHVFHKMLGMSASNRPHDPRESVRNADALAAMIREGRNEESVQFYENLRLAGADNLVVLETLLDRGQIPYRKEFRPRPLLDAQRLRKQGKFIEAESILKLLLQEQPANLDGAMLLLRLYVHDLRDREKAAGIVQHLMHQPTPAANLEFAQRLLHEFDHPPEKAEADALPDTVEGLLAAGYFGTAIEMLEDKAAREPDNFDVRLQLIEAHALHSRDLTKAKKLMKEMEIQKCFNAEQIESAKAKFEEWRAAKPQK